MATVAVIRRDWVATVFAVSAVFAAVTALTSVNAPERVWGAFGAVSYAVSAVVAAADRRRGVSVAVLISLGGALAAPLAAMAITGMAQPEVAVIIRSAAMLLHRGTPYASPATLAAAHNWHAYDPYLPALIVFGIPRVIGGGLLTDPRIWFGIAFVAAFVAALRIARVPRPLWWTLLVTASPVVALPLAVGGDDLPVLGLMCLGLALAARGSRGRWHWAAAAGLALGLAAGMKATAWPAVAVVVVLLAARQGWRAVAGFTAAAFGAALVADGPTVAAHPAAALVNTVLYPLGLAKVASPAASMLPGHMLAAAGTWGHWTALALMILAGAGVGISLIARPPKDAHAAGWRLALGLALVFVLAPASRVGYFVYPLGLAAWLVLSRWPGLPGDLSVDPEPQHGRLAVQGHH
jgi:Glycosyltransferase family 87